MVSFDRNHFFVVVCLQINGNYNSSNSIWSLLSSLKSSFLVLISLCSTVSKDVLRHLLWHVCTIMKGPQQFLVWSKDLGQQTIYWMFSFHNNVLAGPFQMGSPSKKSTWLQRCTLLKSSLHLNYNLRKRLHYLPPAESWSVFVSFAGLVRCGSTVFNLILNAFLRETKIQIEGRWAAGDFLLCFRTRICKVLHRCSVSVWGGRFRALLHALRLKGGSLCTI